MSSNLVEVKIKPAIKRLNRKIDTITVAKELAKPGEVLEIDGFTTKVIEVLTQ